MPVRLNKFILDYDQLIICGPVFPHEVVGFSGGNKYFFPGIAGPEIINFTHWLGALITSYQIIGVGIYTSPGSHRPGGRFHPNDLWLASALVVTHEGLAGLYFGVSP